MYQQKNRRKKNADYGVVKGPVQPPAYTDMRARDAKSNKGREVGERRDGWTRTVFDDVRWRLLVVAYQYVPVISSQPMREHERRKETYAENQGTISKDDIRVVIAMIATGHIIPICLLIHFTREQPPPNECFEQFAMNEWILTIAIVPSKV